MNRHLFLLFIALQFYPPKKSPRPCRPQLARYEILATSDEFAVAACRSAAQIPACRWQGPNIKDQYAFGILTVRFLIAASGNTSDQAKKLAHLLLRYSFEFCVSVIRICFGFRYSYFGFLIDFCFSAKINQMREGVHQSLLKTCPKRYNFC
jgi:hypothetical protein